MLRVLGELLFGYGEETASWVDEFNAEVISLRKTVAADMRMCAVATFAVLRPPGIVLFQASRRAIISTADRRQRTRGESRAAATSPGEESGELFTTSRVAEPLINGRLTRMTCERMKRLAMCKGERILARSPFQRNRPTHCR